MKEEKNIKQHYLDFDKYIKEQLKLGEVGSNEVEEMKEILAQGEMSVDSPHAT